MANPSENPNTPNLEAVKAEINSLLFEALTPAIKAQTMRVLARDKVVLSDFSVVNEESDVNAGLELFRAILTKLKPLLEQSTFTQSEQLKSGDYVFRNPLDITITFSADEDSNSYYIEFPEMAFTIDFSQSDNTATLYFAELDQLSDDLTVSLDEAPGLETLRKKLMDAVCNQESLEVEIDFEIA